MARWATNTGSTIIGSLNIDTIAWTSGSTVRYTFSGSPDLSGVVVGHQLQAAGCTNSLHNGTFEITAVSNVSDYIEVTNSSISDASNNESSSPGTGTAKSAASLLREPTAAKYAQGWLNGEKPPADYFNCLFNQAGRVKTELVEVGYSTVASSSYVDLGGEGITVCPTYSATAWGSTVAASSATDVTGSTITPKTTAGSRVLVGSICSVDYADDDGLGRLALAINGSTLTGANEAWLFTNKFAAGNIHLITSATGGTESYKQQAYMNGGTTNVVTTNGRTWAAEFPSTVAAGTASKGSSQNSTLTDTYEDISSLSVAISPTNNPVLLLSVCNFGLSDPGYTTGFRFTDGSNNYGEWLYRNELLGSSAVSGMMAWVTGDLNGSKTFKAQFKSVTGGVLTIFTGVLHAIELAGDLQQAKPSGTCAVTSTEATITDGSTPLSVTFTPASTGKYLAILTFYGERTGGSNFLSSLKIKQGSTTLVDIPHEQETAADYKSPVTIIAPTGRLTAGESVTITATAQAGATTTYNLKNAALFVIECPEVTEGFSGDPAEVTLEDVLAGPVEVEYNTSYKCSTDDALTIQLLENVNAGGEVQVKEWTLTAPGTADHIASFKWRRPTALAAGDDVTYTVQAKKATGNTVFQPGQLIAGEVPSV